MLHVGCGLGYYTAVMAHCVGPTGRVVAFEVDEALAAEAQQNLASLPWVDATSRRRLESTRRDVRRGPRQCGRDSSLDVWLDAVAVGGRMMLPLTSTMPGMGPTLGKGLVMLLTKQEAGDFSVRVLAVVAIYSAVGVRDAEMNDRLGQGDDGRADAVAGNQTAAPRSRMTSRRRAGCTARASAFRRHRQSPPRRPANRDTAFGSRHLFGHPPHNSGMPHLFDPLTLRGLTLPHRVLVSPMCQYSSVDGFANDWHLVHLGSRAVGGAALVFTEATAVTAEGRISPEDLGIWRDDHVELLARIVRFIHEQRSAAGMQIAHAGRKGSTAAPWNGGLAVAPAAGGWQPVGPTGEPFTAGYPVPRALATADIPAIVDAFRTGGGARWPPASTSSKCTPRTGISFISFSRRSSTRGRIGTADRSRTARGCASTSSRRCAACGRSDCRCSCAFRRPIGRRADGISISRSSCPGCCATAASISSIVRPAVPCRTRRSRSAPGYQVPFAERIRRDAGVATGAVGLITTAAQAEEIVVNGRADCVLLARELLRDPYWPERAARELGRQIPWPNQYLRAAPRETPAR